MAESGETTVQNLKNSVNRETDTVGSDEGGDLYSKEELPRSRQPAGRLRKDRAGRNHIAETLGIMFALGIGADKSTGKGAFDMREVAGSRALTSRKRPTGSFPLSNFIPKAKDPVRGYYRGICQIRQAGQGVRQLPTPFKKPLLFLRCGSAFYDEAPKEWYGRGVFGVSAVSRISWSTAAVSR